MAQSVANKATDDVLEAMRSVQTESDRWTLAETLLQHYPKGNAAIFNEIVDKAKGQGIVGLSATTLRLYRDAAAYWPTSKRIAGVGFSAHLEATRGLPSVDDGVKVLNDLVKTQGLEGITVAKVREAVKIKAGKTSKAKTATKPGSVSLSDLANGAPKLIASIPANTDLSLLDKYHAGLNKALHHVEQLRTKAAAKAKASKAPAPAAKAAPAAKPANGNGGSKPPAPTSKRGDLRGL